MTDHTITLAELLKNGDIKFKLEEGVNTVEFTYTEKFTDWFQDTYGVEVTEEGLSKWFNALLKESLDYYKTVKPVAN